MSSTSEDLGNIIHVPFDEEVDPNKGLADYMWESLKLYKDNIAQIDSTTGRQETYGEFAKRTISLAKALQKKGITCDDVVGQICFNNMEYTATIVASIFIGSKATALDITSSKVSITHCLNLSQPRIIFCDPDIEKILGEIEQDLKFKHEFIIYGDSEKYMTYTQFLQEYHSDDEFKPTSIAKASDTACIGYTSGTSGLSKGAMLTHYGLYKGAKARTLAELKGMRFMMFTLPYWITNLAMATTAILFGITRVIYKCFDVKTLVQVLHDYKVNMTLCSQNVINTLILHPEFTQYDTSNLKIVYYTGSKIGANQIQQFRRIFPEAALYNCLGMTEIAGLVLLPKKQVGEISPNETSLTVGSPNHGFYYRVVDPETGKNVGPNQNGELRIKYQGIFNGYLNNPEATKEAFDEFGYFRTGDIVYYNEDKYFFVVDRLKEIFKYKGNHISPTIIEDQLLLHPAIKEAIVVGMPDNSCGELPMAVVVLKDNTTAVEKEIVEFIKARVADDHQIRGGVKIVESIPKTNTGKYRRNYMRDLILKIKNE